MRQVAVSSGVFSVGLPFYRTTYYPSTVRQTLAISHACIDLMLQLESGFGNSTIHCILDTVALPKKCSGCLPKASPRKCTALPYISGSMRQKRALSEAPQLATLHVRSHFLEQLQKDQEEGTSYYGQALFPTVKRSRRCQLMSYEQFQGCYQGAKPACRI